MIVFTVALTAVTLQWQRACVMERWWCLAVLRLGPALLSSMLLATWACPQPRLPESPVESSFTWEKHCKLLTCLLIANTFPELKEVAKPLSFWAEGWASAYRQRSVLRAVMARAWCVQTLKCLQWPTIIWLSSGPERPPSNKESGEDHQPLMGRRGVGWNYSVVCSPYLCWRLRPCHAGWGVQGQDVGGEAQGLSDVCRLQKWIQKGSKTEPGVNGREHSIEVSDTGCLYVAFETVWAVRSIFLCRRCFVWKVVDTCQRWWIDLFDFLSNQWLLIEISFISLS